MLERPLLVEIFVHHPTVFDQCVDCEVVWKDIEDTQTHPSHMQRAIDGLPYYLAQEYEDIAHWATELAEQYPSQVTVRVIDALSLEGVVKTAQYGINRCPSVVLNHQHTYDWYTLDEACQEITQLLGIPQG